MCLKGLLALSIGLIVSSVAIAEERAADGPRVLLVGKPPDHAYGSHMYMHTCRMLGECARLNGLEPVVSEGWPKNAALLKNVKTVVVYTSPAAELLLDSPHRDEVLRLMGEGVGIVTIHWASTVKQENFDRLADRWMSILGGTWISNVGLSTTTSPLKQLDPRHPICRGWSEYELLDEYYLNPKITDGKPLLQVTTNGQEVIVGWAYERPDGGRSYATTLGHFYSNFERAPFRQALVNAILWTAKREVPEQGGRIDVAEKILRMPLPTAETLLDGPFPAHRVIGNVYYVGSRQLATYLITTPEGHLLINSGFEETVPIIQKGIESLGFKPTDVKIVLASHAHSDHVAGHAKLRELTGAKVYVMEGDDAVIASGGEGQYLYDDSRWAPCPVDVVLKDGDPVRLGGVTLVARRTAGHTRGCTTWTWRVDDGGASRDVVVIGSPNVNPGYRLVDNPDYPAIAADYARTFQVLKSLPCDVFLGAHGEYYGLPAKHNRLKSAKAGDPNPFIDPEGYRAYVELKEKAFRETLAEQRRAGEKKE